MFSGFSPLFIYGRSVARKFGNGAQNLAMGPCIKNVTYDKCMHYGKTRNESTLQLCTILRKIAQIINIKYPKIMNKN